MQSVKRSVSRCAPKCVIFIGLKRSLNSALPTLLRGFVYVCVGGCRRMRVKVIEGMTLIVSLYVCLSFEGR